MQEKRRPGFCGGGGFVFHGCPQGGGPAGSIVISVGGPCFLEPPEIVG